MVVPLRTSAALLVGSLAACLPPPVADCADCSTLSPVTWSESTGAKLPTTSGDTDEVQTVTGEPAPDTFGETTNLPVDPSTGEPALPPTIVDEHANPGTLMGNGAIKVTVTTENADGVSMKIHNDDVIVLTPAGPDQFEGQISILSGKDNGVHTATLTPKRGKDEGADKQLQYEIQLPAPGVQKFWESGDLIGAGKVVALGVLPDGLLVEFGTFLTAKHESRCYLRRRQQDGTWFEQDFVEVLPGSDCSATDMRIDPELGTLYVLVDRTGGDGKKWWLGEIASWGKGVKNIGLGASDEIAESLAHTSGVVAVCGAKPWLTSRDAAAWLHRPNTPVEKRVFDYVKPDLGAHKFAETVRDCVFAKGTLVMVGEALGKLQAIGMERNHRFILEHDTVTNFDTWTIAGPGPGTQSRALAVAVDDDGRYLIAGLTCGDVCEPDGELRIYLPGGTLEWQAPLGPLLTELAGPNDIAWSPAGYMVIALGGFDGKTLRFKVDAYEPEKFDAMWSFIPDEEEGLQVALALAIGAMGEVYAGGIGDNNFPAVAYIAG